MAGNGDNIISNNKRKVMNMKEKITKFFKKVAKFSMLEFLLFRKIGKTLKSIELKEGLIDYYKSLITDANGTIAFSEGKIKNLTSEIEMLKEKIEDIERV